MGFTLYQTGILPGLPDKQVFSEDTITVENFFSMLSTQYGAQALEEVLDQGGDVAEGAMVILNGQILRRPQILSTVIPQGSEIVISALIAGG
ncbi:MAG: MoaD/ThiS family protein [Peptococcaceae bacterium]|jgi:sulfur carrier protein ThiS|nr:MoaD/ThiS family protein [Peptococcaceae bacterium]